MVNSTKEMGVYPKQWIMEIKDVVTLALGSQPRQRFAKVRTKYEARESHFMFLRMQESVKE
jgi:hypothetical protein